ncbi:MAG: response regulator transcription factor [Planctomycetota bacterium]
MTPTAALRSPVVHVPPPAQALELVVVSEQATLREALSATLASDGHSVVATGDAARARRLVLRGSPQAAVFDLSQRLGLGRLLADLRERGSRLSVLGLVAQDTPAVRSLGLASGADDALARDYAPLELRAWVNALLRRANPSGATLCSYADLELEPESGVATRGGRGLGLNGREVQLLARSREPEAELTRAVLTATWGREPAETNLLEVYVRYLRGKLDAWGPRLVHTVRGVGYVLRVKED